MTTNPASAVEVKVDDELHPAVGGFAPGSYWNTCVRCDMMFEGHKRSTHCWKCATALAQPTSASDDREGLVERLREALAWYGEQARLCRLIHSEGDAGRHALDNDGGKRARAALAGKDVAP